MAIAASTISSTQTLEEFRLEYNKLRSDVSTLENPTYGASLTFEGATADAYETTLTVVDPTADRTITLPNITGTIITTGDTGTVTVTMMAGGTDGNIISFDASGNPVAVATGSDGHYYCFSTNPIKRFLISCISDFKVFISLVASLISSLCR